LCRIEATVPADLDVHRILDNYAMHKTPAINRWLLRQSRFHRHFTPTSGSWLNLVERWFAELTTKRIRRGTHRSELAWKQTSATGSVPGTSVPSRSSGS
jgi:transposase